MHPLPNALSTIRHDYRTRQSLKVTISYHYKGNGTSFDIVYDVTLAPYEQARSRDVLWFDVYDNEARGGIEPPRYRFCRPVHYHFATAPECLKNYCKYLSSSPVFGSNV